MKKKLITKTYVRDVSQFNMKIYQLEDYYVCIKQIVKTNSPFVTSTGLKLIDNNYQIVEILPIKENYAMRVFLNDKKQIVQRYFDITQQNAIDAEANVPFYYDLYLDIVVEKDDIRVLDEAELDLALKNNQVSKTDYELAKNTKNQLLKELMNGENKLLAFDFSKYLF